ncbi:MAG: hypothetical protein IJW64_03015 [Clostridia bacterium]|nr:hypothetical protein [Clostridia bacterium]
MVIFVYVLVSVYMIAINVYSFMLLNSQKKAEEDGECSKVRDGSLFITAILGGALGIYVAIFALKYRTKSLFLMVFMPVIIVINAFILIQGFTNGFWIFNVKQTADLIKFLTNTSL